MLDRCTTIFRMSLFAGSTASGCCAKRFPVASAAQACAIGKLRVACCGKWAVDLGKPEDSLVNLRGSPIGAIRILDTDSFSAINRILRGMLGYSHSQFRPDRRNGDVLEDGSININLREFPPNVGAFDIIITSDVMEHVDDDEQAHREIHRCLSSGGAYLFTVPYDPCLLGTRKLTQSTGEPELRFILDKQIHGDPHSGSGILAHRIYGRQLLTDLAQVGYEVTFESIEDPAHGIFGGYLFTAV